MKKIYVSRPQVEPTQYPQRVAILELFGAGLTVRYFDVVESPTPESEALDAIPPLTSSIAESLIVGGALPEVPYLAGRFLQEKERQTLDPSALSPTDMFSIAELYDFVAIVHPVSFTGAPGTPFSYFVDAATAKAGLRRVGQNREAMMFLTFTATHAQDPIENWTIIRAEHQRVAFVDRTPGSWETAPVGFKVLSTLPTVEITAPTTVPLNGSATVEFQVVDQDGEPHPYEGELVVEALAGYVSKRRIPVTAGAGSVSVFPLGLVAGDVIRIKVGTRLITGLADTAITVTA